MGSREWLGSVTLPECPEDVPRIRFSQRSGDSLRFSGVVFRQALLLHPFF